MQLRKHRSSSKMKKKKKKHVSWWTIMTPLNNNDNPVETRGSIIGDDSWMWSCLILENEGLPLFLHSMQCITLHYVMYKWAISLAVSSSITWRANRVTFSLYVNTACSNLGHHCTMKLPDLLSLLFSFALYKTCIFKHCACRWNRVSSFLAVHVVWVRISEGHRCIVSWVSVLCCLCVYYPSWWPLSSCDH